MTILERFKNGEFAITNSTMELVDYLHKNDDCLTNSFMVNTTLTHVDYSKKCLNYVMHGENSAGLPAMTAQRFLQLVKEEGEEDLSPVKIRILSAPSVWFSNGETLLITENGAIESNGDTWVSYLDEEGENLLEKWDNYWSGHGITYEVIEDVDIESKTLVKQLSKNGFSISLDFESGMISEIFEVKKENLSDLIELLQEAEKEFKGENI